MSTAPAKINFKMFQGSTFSEVLRWESSEKVYADITAITKAAPCVITATSHGMPDGWRCKITSVAGMTQLNDTDNYRIGTVLTADSIELNDVNSLGYSTYTGGGVVEYNKPIEMAGYTARMQIRSSLSSTDFIAEYTTENGGISIDTANYTITITDDAVSTAAYTFSTAVYSMELIVGAEVIPFASGTITLIKEVTR